MVSQIYCAMIYFHQQLRRVTISACHCQHLLLLIFLILSILAGQMLQLILVFICIYLIMSDVDYLFISNQPCSCLFLKTSVHFWLGSLFSYQMTIFLYSGCKSFIRNMICKYVLGFLFS
jgi:hypothetical protein